MLSRSSARITALGAAAPLLVQSRSYHGFQFASFHGWTLPYGHKSTRVTKEELENLKYFSSRPKDKWDYHRVDENINASSEFRKTEGRDEFFSRHARTTLPPTTAASIPRQRTASTSTLTSHEAWRGPKVAACYAVTEQWDAEEFYYPGEAWQKNRPGFRSVPKELLNRQTWYHWSDTIFKWDEIQPTIRTRSWNPDWPPPGYHMPKLNCKKEFEFGCEDEGLVSEIERYNWFRSWGDNNMRAGWMEIPLFIMLFGTLYYLARQSQTVNLYRAVASNMYYPGRYMIRPFGSPTDLENDCYWWQKPLEEFPNQGEVWYMNQSRYGYIQHLQKRDAREKELAAAEEAAQEASA
ncbi:hypothetical protein STCU_04383 [Strigomonas culicis]|uniref:Uncharacterized protein n=1 Tax=Strigomonas culicis TaxID=28005 RepID=S9UL47_9TRYP|nr:hypothetical protein STCU_04383 [Strigomonas culicis]|eukprot:EPY29638.1 hypothetical protein STCU_04383 [Strigomonas culicis]